MILAFDLDDTLYEERTFVESGFRAVAELGEARFGWNRDVSLRFMLDVLEREGRGRVFDRWLQSKGVTSRQAAQACVRRYRHHKPAISLYPAARRVLTRYAGKAPLYLVTDGHKIVQANKIAALEISGYFRWTLVTHRFGIRNAKPSIHCFERIRARERCGWSEMVYVADNPAKDFVGLNPLGVKTIRVLTGEHRHEQARPGHEAAFAIETLDALPPLVDMF